MTTPIPRFEKSYELKDGTPVTVRPLRAEDRAELRRSVQSLSEETTMHRFFRAHVDATDAFLDQLLDVDGVDHVALAAFVPTPDLKEERCAGVARFHRLGGDDEKDAAEAAVTVLDDYQRRGLGRILLTELVTSARRVGIKRFRAEVLVDNLAVMSILAQTGAIEVARAGPVATYDVVVDETPTATSRVYALLKAIGAGFRRAPPKQS